MIEAIENEFTELESIETREWIESLDYVIEQHDPRRVRNLLESLREHAQAAGIKIPPAINTPYINTIPVEEQPPFPGDIEIERRIKSLVRWNAMAMVVRANKAEDGIGGHISTYASAATLYEVGLITFSGAQTRSMMRMSSSSRATLHRVCMRELFSKDDSPSNSLRISVAS